MVEAFLTQIYKAGDSSYPPIGTVVTLSSPLRGDPLASAVVGAQKHRSRQRSDERSRQDPSSHSSARAAVRLGRGARSGVRLAVHAAARARDVARAACSSPQSAPRPTSWCPATPHRDPARGASTVIPRSLFAHTGILSDPTALRNVRAALEGQTASVPVAGRTRSPARCCPPRSAASKKASARSRPPRVRQSR